MEIEPYSMFSRLALQVCSPVGGAPRREWGRVGGNSMYTGLAWRWKEQRGENFFKYMLANRVLQCVSSCLKCLQRILGMMLKGSDVYKWINAQCKEP